MSIRAAKTNFSRLVAVKLVPTGTSAPRRRRGSLQGEVFVPDSLLDPLPAHELDAWEQ